MNDTKQNEIDNKDERLIELAAKGDAEAVREIVELHQAMVYGTCLRILRNAADAEDAAQATFIVFLKKCPKLKRGTVLGGWLYHTAAYVSREFIRTSTRCKRREEEAGTMNELTTQESAQAWNELQPELDDAVMALPQKYRNVVVLRYLEGRSTGEAAGILGMSASAVTTCLARAIEKLRGRFQRRGIVLSAAVLSCVLAQNAAAASVPATLGSSVLAAVVKGAVVTAASANVNLLVEGVLAKMTWMKIKLAAVFGTLVASSAILVGVGLESRQVDALGFNHEQTEQANAVMTACRDEYLAIEKKYTKELRSEENLVEYEIAPFPKELAELKAKFWQRIDTICNEQQQRVARRYLTTNSLFPFGERQHTIEISFNGKQYTVLHTINYQSGPAEEHDTHDVLMPRWKRFWGDRKEGSQNLVNKFFSVGDSVHIMQEPALSMESDQPVLTSDFIDTLQLDLDKVERINQILKNMHNEYLVIEKKHIGKVVTDPNGAKHVEVASFSGERKALERKLWAELEKVLDERQMRVTRNALTLDDPNSDLFPYGDYAYSLTFLKKTNGFPGLVVKGNYSGGFFGPKGSFSDIIHSEDMPVYVQVEGEHKRIGRTGSLSPKYSRLLAQ